MVVIHILFATLPNLVDIIPNLPFIVAGKDYCLLTERGQGASMKNQRLPAFISSSEEVGFQKSSAKSLIKYPSSMLFRHKSHKNIQRKLADDISENRPLQRSSTSQSSTYSEQVGSDLSTFPYIVSIV